jgi:ABC-type protease/lipase transport system fused ATPase/permease subunit
LLQSADKIMVIKEGTAQAIGKRDDIIPLLAANGAAKGAPAAPGSGTFQ